MKNPFKVKPGPLPKYGEPKTGFGFTGNLLNLVVVRHHQCGDVLPSCSIYEGLPRYPLWKPQKNRVEGETF